MSAPSLPLNQAMPRHALEVPQGGCLANVKGRRRKAKRRSLSVSAAQAAASEFY